MSEYRSLIASALPMLVHLDDRLLHEDIDGSWARLETKKNNIVTVCGHQCRAMFYFFLLLVEAEKCIHLNLIFHF